jgi:PAS domain S-box-containing protein
MPMERPSLSDRTPRPAGSMPPAPDARLRTVHEMTLAISASLDLERVLSEIVDSILQLFDGASVVIYLMNSSINLLERVFGSHIPALRAGQSFSDVRTLGEGTAGRTASAGRTVQIEDAERDDQKLDRFGPGRKVLGVIALPLVYSGDVLGVIEIGFPRRGALPPADVETLEMIAAHAAVAISHARLFERSREMLALMQGINDRTAAVSSVAQAILDARHDLHRMLADALQRVLSLLGFKGGSILLANPTGNSLHVVVHYNFPQDDGVLAPQQLIRPGRPGLAARVALERQSILVADVARDPITQPALDPLRRFGIAAIAGVPLIASEDVMGVLLVTSDNSKALEAGVLDTLRVIAGALALGVSNARAYSRVRADQEQFRAVIGSSGDVVLSLDRQGRITLANEAAQRAFGFEAQAVVGKPLADATTNVALNQAVEQAVRSGMRDRIGFEVPLVDESVLFCNLSPIADEDQQLVGWVAVMQDITRFKETERMKSDMILTASHDLRNPVNLTLGALDMLVHQQDTLTPTQREVLELAMIGVRRIEALISDLLDLERVERRVGLQLRECNLAEIANTVALENRMLANSKNQSLDTRLPEAVPFVWGDSKRLYQVVANLVGNAIKYTPSGGRISVTLHQENEQLVLDVADNGRGIPQEAQARVFERFYRVAGSSSIDATGTGLGLALVKSIVEQHGGRVWVTSQVGIGSTFSISLPVWHPPHPNGEPVASESVTEDVA